MNTTTDAAEGDTAQNELYVINNVIQRLTVLQTTMEKRKRKIEAESRHRVSLRDRTKTRQAHRPTIERSADSVAIGPSLPSNEERNSPHSESTSQDLRLFSSKVDALFAEFASLISSDSLVPTMPHKTAHRGLADETVGNSTNCCAHDQVDSSQNSQKELSISTAEAYRNERSTTRVEVSTTSDPYGGQRPERATDIVHPGEVLHVCRRADLLDKSAFSIQQFAEGPGATQRGFCHILVKDHLLSRDGIFSIPTAKSSTGSVQRYHQAITFDKMDGFSTVTWREQKSHRRDHNAVIRFNDIHEYDLTKDPFSTGDSDSLKSIAYTIGDVTAFGEQVHGYLDCGETTRKAFTSTIPGVTEPYVYCSEDKGSCSMMHIEDLSLASANIVLQGSPKVWLIVNPASTARFEECVRELCIRKGLKTTSCSQWMRHLNLVFSRSKLDEWRVVYTTVTCKAGEMIVTLPGVYHQVVNTGPNVAEAVNMAWEGTDLSFSASILCDADMGCSEESVDQGLRCNNLRYRNLTPSTSASQHGMTTRSQQADHSESSRPTHLQKNNGIMAESPGNNATAPLVRNGKRKGSTTGTVPNGKRSKGTIKPPTRTIGSEQPAAETEDEVSIIQRHAEDTLQKSGVLRCLTLLKAFRCSIGDVGNGTFIPQRNATGNRQYQREVFSRMRSASEQSLLVDFTKRLCQALLNKSTSPPAPKVRRTHAEIEKIVGEMYPEIRMQSQQPSTDTDTYSQVLPEDISAKSARDHAKSSIYKGGFVCKAVGDDFGYLACLGPKINLSSMPVAKRNYEIMNGSALGRPLRDFGLPFAEMVQGNRDMIFRFDEMLLDDPAVLANIRTMRPEDMLRAIEPSPVLWKQLWYPQHPIASTSAPCIICTNVGWCKCSDVLLTKAHPALRVCIAQGRVELRAVHASPRLDSTGLSISILAEECIFILPGSIGRPGTIDIHQLEHRHMKIMLSDDYEIFVDTNQFFVKALLRAGMERDQEKLKVEVRVISGRMWAVIVASRAIQTGEIIRAPAEFGHESLAAKQS